MHTEMKRFKKNPVGKRLPALALGAILALESPFVAVAEVTSGVRPTVDEAYYVSLDSYGNPTDAAVVKSYALNGANEVVDYGSYDSVENLTNGIKPEISEGKVRFSLGENAPSHFYFEGKTRAPFETLPFVLSIQYRLNGVPVEAAQLAGEKGVVEIHIRAVPNPASSEYQKNNWFLTAAAVFNQNDILSLSAPDAQIQTVGNLKTAVFFWLPGEEKEYVLSVGSEDFSFNGFTFLLGPINAAGRLGDLKDLQDSKRDIEDSWKQLTAAGDQLYDSMQGMQGKLGQAADGLDGLNRVQKNIQSRESGNMDALTADLGPVGAHMDAADRHIGELEQNLGELNRNLLSLKQHLKESESTLTSLRDNTESLQDASDDLERDSRAIQSDLKAIRELSANGKKTAEQTVGGTLAQMGALYQAYAQYMQAHGLQPVDSGNRGANQGSFQDFASRKLASLGYSDEQIAYALTLWNRGAEVQAAAAQANDIYGKVDVLGDDLDALRLSSLYDALYGSASTGTRAAADAGALSGDLQQSISALNRLYETTDSYLPELQDSLRDAAALSEHLRDGSASLTALLRTTRDILQSNSAAFHGNADLSLGATASILRQSASALDSTDALHQASESIRSLVENKWDENTGEKTRLFSLDVNAAPESLTAAENDNVSSVSVMLRSAEIKKTEAKTQVKGAQNEKKPGLLARIGKMFSDIWSFLTAWTHH